MNKEITLPSGAILKITVSPFSVSKALYQAILEEAKTLKLNPEADVDVNLFKDLFCAGFSSKKIEQALNDCMKKVLYNNKHITDDTFEDVAAREDYLTVCLEVTLANVLPFIKNLTHEYSRILVKINESLPSK